MTEHRMTLWDTEGAWVEALEAVSEAETEESQKQALVVYDEALRGAVEKRERLAGFIRHVDARVDYLKAEEERLRARRKALESGRERLMGFVTTVMQSLGLKKVEGTTSTFTLCQNASSALRVVVPDDKVPIRFWVQPPPVLDRKALGEAVKAGESDACGAAYFEERGFHVRMR